MASMGVLAAALSNQNPNMPDDDICGPFGLNYLSHGDSYHSALWHVFLN